MVRTLRRDWQEAITSHTTTTLHNRQTHIFSTTTGFFLDRENNKCSKLLLFFGCRRDRNRTVVGFTTTCAISAYHQFSCEFESCWWGGVLDATLCDKICQWMVSGRWFSPGNPVSSTNKTDLHDIPDILLKMVLNTLT